MKLLISHKPFQKLVAEIRDRLDIPKGGFNKSNSENRHWSDEILARSDAMMDSKEFNEKLRAIYEARKRGEITPREARQQNDALHHEVPCNYFHNMPRFLVAKFNVPEHFALGIQWYILRGTYFTPTTNFTGGPLPPGKRQGDMRYLPVNIYAQLTDEELQDLKRYIATWAPQLPKFNPVENIDSKLTIEEWLEQDRTYLDPDTMIRKRTTLEDLAKTAMREGLIKKKATGKDIYDIGRSMEKLRKQRFGEQRFGKE